MDNQKQIWALQLLRYFVVSKGYTQVRFIDTTTKQEDQDIWLANQASNKYVVIHITARQAASSIMSNDQNTLLQARSIINILKKSGKTLNICFDESNVSAEGDEMDYISVYPNCPMNDGLLAEFPGLNSVCFNVDDPAEEQKKLLKEINDYALKHNNVKQRKRRELWNSISTTFKIVAPICILLYLCINIAPLILHYEVSSWSIVFGAYYKAFIVILNEWYRLFTSGFVHISLLHLLCNLSALLNISKVVEDRLGTFKTMLVLVISIIAGNLAVFMGNGNILCVGLSGGLYGLMAVTFIIYWKEGYFKYPNFVRSIMSVIYINLLMNFMPNVSVLSHVGGFIAGVFLGFILTSSDKALKVNTAICLIIILIGLGYFSWRNCTLDTYYYLTDKEVADIFKNVGLDGIGTRIETETYNYYYGGK